MKYGIFAIVALVGIIAIYKFSNLFGQDKKNTEVNQMYNYPMTKTDDEWKKTLTPQQYSVLREKETDRPFVGKYEAFFENGDYKCAACGSVLFSSDSKFDAHCGWPSFSEVKEQGKVKEIKDTSLGMVRTEVVCANCGGHLGHVFDDGPKPNGMRYCINSTSIEFQKKDTVKK